jgi:hypothetical protein
VPRRHQGRECGAELLGLVRRGVTGQAQAWVWLRGADHSRPGHNSSYLPCDKGSTLRPPHHTLHAPVHPALHPVLPPSGPSWSTLRPTSPPCCPPTTQPTSLSSSTPRGAASAASPPNDSTTLRLAVSHRSRRQTRPSLQPWWVAFLRPAATSPGCASFICACCASPFCLPLTRLRGRSPHPHHLHSSTHSAPLVPLNPSPPGRLLPRLPAG